MPAEPSSRGAPGAASRGLPSVDGKRHTPAVLVLTRRQVDVRHGTDLYLTRPECRRPSFGRCPCRPTERDHAWHDRIRISSTSTHHNHCEETRGRRGPGPSEGV